MGRGFKNESLEKRNTVNGLQWNCCPMEVSLILMYPTMYMYNAHVHMYMHANARYVHVHLHIYMYIYTNMVLGQ